MDGGRAASDVPFSPLGYLALSEVEPVNYYYAPKDNLAKGREDQSSLAIARIKTRWVNGASGGIEVGIVVVISSCSCSTTAL